MGEQNSCPADLKRIGYDYEPPIIHTWFQIQAPTPYSARFGYVGNHFPFEAHLSKSLLILC